MGGRWIGFNETGLQAIYLQVDDRSQRICELIRASAQGFAPVRKKGNRRRKTTVQVTFSRRDEDEPLFVPGRNGRLIRNTVSVFDVKTRRGRNATPSRFTLTARLPRASRASATARRAIARRFGGLGPPQSSRRATRLTLTFNTGQSGGHLRKNIRVGEVQQDGKRIRQEVRSWADYSWYMEVGFHHVGGTEVPGQHFMLKGLEANRQAIKG